MRFPTKFVMLLPPGTYFLLITFTLTHSVCTCDWLYALRFSNTSKAARPTTLLLLSNKGGRGKFYVEHTQFQRHPNEWNDYLLYIPKWSYCGLKRVAKQSLADFTTNYLDNLFAYMFTDWIITSILSYLKDALQFHQDWVFLSTWAKCIHIR